jgi:DNA-binding NtrC family response regulator
MGESKKIVHVDGSGFFRKIVDRYLNSQGYEVESFDNWGEASLALGGGVGMLITGLKLRDGDGPDLIEREVEAFSGDIIVMSSDVDEELADTLKHMGCTAALPKSGNWKEQLSMHLH